jgi:hypothetical protein
MTVRAFEAIGPPTIAVVGAVVGLIIVVACGLLSETGREQLARSGSEPPVVCDGKPDWCLVARSELLGHTPSYVYVDGELKTLVLPGKTAQVPMTAGTRHLVNYCAYAKDWSCSTPASMNFADGDATLVIYPLNVGTPSKDEQKAAK